MTSHIHFAGTSRSFPDGPIEIAGDGRIFAGGEAGAAYAGSDSSGSFAAIELDHDLLAQHIGLESDAAHTDTVGFARFRVGDAAPSALVELVKLPWTRPAAVDAARAAFESAGFSVAICGDTPGRIVNRLIRPYLNAVLRRLDDGLASAEDMDTTLRLGLGYPEGPHALLARTGLVDHFNVSNALYAMTGDPDLAPARRARVAAERAGS